LVFFCPQIMFKHLEF